ncbi:MAG: peptide chain release factor 1 [Myxococcota bacterium]|jgi:peptide chain release factor 1
MSIQNLEQSEARLEELDRALMDPAVLSDTDRLMTIARERGHLEPIIRLWRALSEARQELAEAHELLDDPEMRAMASAEIDAIRERIPPMERELRQSLIPPDPYEGRDVILEIRAGTGGDEAALFAADLFRMYSRFAESSGIRVELMDSSRITVGSGGGKSAEGFKEIIAQLSGPSAYNLFRHESGAHRVQRVPLTESQGRIHTSAATVAVLPVADEIEVEINDSDLRIDVMRASGAGGQHVNTTDSAVRITHLPTGLVVRCEDEKSQHKNKAKAMKVLAARLLEQIENAAHEERAADRRAQVGSGDRSERIRTYNYPQNRITDHRINVTLYKLDRIVQGDLGELIDALNGHLQEMLAAQYTGDEL